MDSGDKATNKAMSIAFKYACFQVFCIPTEEMKDPDSDTPDPSAPIYATDDMRKKFIEECTRIGKPKSAILKVIGAKGLAELTVEQYEIAMQSFLYSIKVTSTSPVLCTLLHMERIKSNIPWK